MSMRVLFLGTPDFAVPVLKVLAQSPFKLVGVVTQPDRPKGRNLEVQPSAIKAQALELGGVESLDGETSNESSKSFPIFSPEKISAQDIAAFRKLRVDVAVVVAFGQILSEEFLSSFPFGAVNVHASLLPRWRGAGPIQWSLWNDDIETGVSLQKVVKKLDAGDVLGEKTIGITNDLDAPKLYSTLSDMGAQLVSEVLPDYLCGKITPQPQDDSKVTVARKITKADGLIDWNKTARQIFCQMQALKPWPGTYTRFRNSTLKILTIQGVSRGGKNGAISHNTGVVSKVDKNSFSVNCGDGTVEVLEVQPESRARMSARQFIDGFKLAIGDRFE